MSEKYYNIHGGHTRRNAEQDSEMVEANQPAENDGNIEKIQKASDLKQAHARQQQRLDKGEFEARALNDVYDNLLQRRATGEPGIEEKIQQFEIDQLGKKTNESGPTATLRIGETRQQIATTDGDRSKIDQIIEHRLKELDAIWSAIWEITREERDKMPEKIKRKERKELIESFGDGQIDALYKRIIERIERETDFFKITQDIGTHQNILEHNFEDRKIAGTKVYHGPKILEKVIPTLGGFYNPIANFIYINAEIKKKRDILRALASWGRFTRDISTLNHEIVHAWQFKEAGHKLKRNMEMLTSARRNLIEAQAYRAGLLSAESDGAGADPEYFANHVQRSVPFFLNQGTKITTDAIEIVDKLNALGVDQKEIADLITKSKSKTTQIFAEKRTIFPNMEKRAQQEMDKLGLDERQMEGLTAAYLLENQVAALRARQITLQEIRAVEKQNKDGNSAMLFDKKVTG